MNRLAHVRDVVPAVRRPTDGVQTERHGTNANGLFRADVGQQGCFLAQLLVAGSRIQPNRDGGEEARGVRRVRYNDEGLRSRVLEHLAQRLYEGGPIGGDVAVPITFLTKDKAGFFPDFADGSGGERAYWDLERLLKRWQSLAGSVTSATGALHALRALLVVVSNPPVTS